MENRDIKRVHHDEKKRNRGEKMKEQKKKTICKGVAGVIKKTAELYVGLPCRGYMYEPKAPECLKKAHK